MCDKTTMELASDFSISVNNPGVSSTAELQAILIAPNFNPNRLDAKGYHPLALVCEQLLPELVVSLLALATLDVNQLALGKTALHYVVASGGSKAFAIAELLVRDPRIKHLPDIYGETPLITACRKGDTEMMQLLCKIPGVDINYLSPSQDTALIAAVLYTRLDTVKALLQIPDLDLNLAVKRAASTLHGYCADIEKMPALTAVELLTLCDARYLGSAQKIAVIHMLLSHPRISKDVVASIQALLTNYPPSWNNEKECILRILKIKDEKYSRARILSIKVT